MTKVSGKRFARGCKRHIQLGKILRRFLDFLNRTFFTLIDFEEEDDKDQLPHGHFQNKKTDR